MASRLELDSRSARLLFFLAMALYLVGASPAPRQPANQPPMRNQQATAKLAPLPKQSSQTATLPTGPSPFAQTIATVKDVLNGLFFLVVGVITVLTYRQAKKTVLQPLKTEIFKQQIQLFSELLKLFVGKDEVELREQFAFEKMLIANLHYQWDIYMRLRFGTVVDESQRSYNRKLCPSSSFIIHDHEVAQEPKLDDVMNLALLPPSWEQHQVREIRIPSEHSAMKDKIVEFLESPLVPKQLAVLLNSYLELASQNVDQLRAAIKEYNSSMPQMCPTFEHRKQLNSTPLHNLFSQRFHPLKPTANLVIDYIRTYFSVEELMKIG